MYKNNNVYSNICWEYPLQTKFTTKRNGSKRHKKNNFNSHSNVKKSTVSAYAYYGAIILFFAGLLFFITISISKAAIAEPRDTSDNFAIPYDTDSNNLLLEDLATLYKSEKKDNADKENLEAKITRPIVFTKQRVLNNESLKKLASRYKLTEDTIILVNGLKRPSDLKTGDIVTIPNQDGRLIQVKANDSIYKISERYGVSWKKIVDCNNLSDINIKTGMKLFIPDSGMTKYEREKFYQIKPKQAAPVVQNTSNAARKNTVTSNIFSWPIKGAITSSYGQRSDPFTGVKDFHTGLDIRGAMNTSVKAPYDGTVAFTGWSNVYGNFILIKHENNIVTMYGHLNEINVKKGENIKRGSIIGAVGTTGRSTGPHLHFEVLKNNKRENPLSFLMEKESAT
ncbi:MAG: M23 family metallopeptidase [Spirochaetales bacterium]|nr:M23 family metallopeptidase [Spirochaetales bacterium]